MQNKFKVTKQYGRGSEAEISQFSQLNEAKAFVDERLLEDASLNVQATYRIYEYGEVYAEYDSTKVDIAKLQQSQSSADAQGSQGKGSSASFRPTPLNTAPRPPGTPQKWSNDDDEDEKK